MVYLGLPFKQWWFSMAMLNNQRVYIFFDRGTYVNWDIYIYSMIFPTMWGPLVSYKSYIYWSYVHQLSSLWGPTACTLSYWKVASHRTKTRRFSKPGHPVPGPLKCIPWSYFALPSHHGFNIDLLFSLIICATTCRSYIDIYHMIVNCMMKFFLYKYKL